MKPSTDKPVQRPASPQGEPRNRRVEDRPSVAPEEPRDESMAESIGRAITAPVRDAAEDEDRRQTGQR